MSFCVLNDDGMLMDTTCWFMCCENLQLTASTSARFQQSGDEARSKLAKDLMAASILGCSFRNFSRRVIILELLLLLVGLVSGLLILLVLDVAGRDD